MVFSRKRAIDQFIEIDMEKLTQRKIRRAQSKWEALILKRNNIFNK